MGFLSSPWAELPSPKSDGWGPQHGGEQSQEGNLKVPGPQGQPSPLYQVLSLYCQGPPVINMHECSRPTSFPGSPFGLPESQNKKDIWRQVLRGVGQNSHFQLRKATAWNSQSPS